MNEHLDDTIFAHPIHFVHLVLVGARDVSQVIKQASKMVLDEPTCAEC